MQKIPGIGTVTASAIASFRRFEEAEAEAKFLEDNHISAHFFLEEAYPERLKHIQDCPILLYAKGDADLSPAKTIAIVGTRKITDYGKQFVQQFIEELSGMKLTVVSGMAYGVDVTAHKECLKHGLNTIGVLAHGLDRLYPNLHLRVAKEMLRQEGALITEYPSGTNPDRENFPKRNRVVAGMVDAVIVVESALRGGSLITAELANQYNREVMALPGNIRQEYSRGCNYLIKKNKAHLIESVADLVRIMNWDVKIERNRQPSLFADLNDKERRILDIIRQFEEIGIDQLVVQAGFSSGELAVILLGLEMKNCISSLPGKRYQVI